MQTFTTGTADTGKRVGIWRAMLRESFGLDYDVEPAPDLDFDARIETVQVGPVTVMEASGSAHRALGRGTAHSVTVLAPLRGTLVVRRDGGYIEAGPGSIVFLPMSGAAEFALEQGFHNVAAVFSEEDLTVAFPDWKRRADVVYPADCGAAAVLVALLKSVAQHGRCLEECDLAAIGSSVLNLAAATLACIPVGDRGGTRMEQYHIARVKQFIDKNLRNAELDVCVIARGVCLSPRYLHKLFTRDSCHLMQWVWTRRLDHCYRDLTLDSQPGRSISQIAYSWGFNDAAHFSRVFRNRFGMSPKEAREHGRTPAGNEMVPFLADTGT